MPQFSRVVVSPPDVFYPIKLQLVKAESVLVGIDFHELSVWLALYHGGKLRTGNDKNKMQGILLTADADTIQGLYSVPFHDRAIAILNVPPE